jgi:short-subunit dehydrogenase
MSTRVSELYRTAFITGASTGLGRAFAEMLLAEGVQVWGTSRDSSRLTAIALVNREAFHAVSLELRGGARVADVFAAAEREAGGFDIVINNAGYGVFGEFATTEFGVWAEQIDVMLTQPARISHLALRGMLARNRGALVNIASIAGEFPMPFQSIYNTVKAGLIALDESLMVETAGTGVCVIDFRPGDYQTDFDGSVRRPAARITPRMQRAWDAFAAMMRSGPQPSHAAESLRRALLRRQSGTVRTGRFFQAVMAPLLARFGSLPLRRKIQAKYFNV